MYFFCKGANIDVDKYEKDENKDRKLGDITHKEESMRWKLDTTGQGREMINYG